MTGVVSQGLRRGLRRLGVDVVRYTPQRFPDLRRNVAIRERGVDLVLDVGASSGQWARLVRRGGYPGRIVSFEPLDEVFAQLREAAQSDPSWEVRQAALSDEDGSTTINVSPTSWSSSLLPMARLHTESVPGSAYAGTQQVETVRLDSLRGDVVRAGDRILMKLDVQGFELPVLRGGTEMLSQVEALEVELSHAQLYAGQALLPEVVAYLAAAGFDLVGIEPVFADPRNGRTLQVDGFFLRNGAG